MGVGVEGCLEVFGGELVFVILRIKVVNVIE